MAEPAVLQATFADWRTVKGRKQLQLIFEVPIEQQAHVLSVLGAPLSDTATWVAIARLGASPEIPGSSPNPKNADRADKARQAFHDDNEMGQAARLAGMLRKDISYQNWLFPQYQHVAGVEGETFPQHISRLQRMALGVQSCSEIATDPAAYERWRAHLLSFEQAVGRAARPS